MKHCVTLLKVVLVVVFIEAVLGDVEGGERGSNTVEGGEPPGNVESICLPEVGDRNHTPTFYILRESVSPCLHEFQIHVLYNTTADHRREIVEGICQTGSRFKECLAEQASRLAVCPDQNLLKAFNVVRDSLEHTFEAGCIQNGERFFTLFSPTWNVDKTRLDKCQFRFYSVIKNLEENNVDMSTRLFIAHKEIPPFKECVGHVGFDLPVQETVDYFIDETIATMKCIHPKDGTLVACTSIDPAEVTFSNICDVKTNHGQLNTYEVLEDEAFTWFADIITQDKHDANEEDITTDIEKLREDFKEFCSGRYRFSPHLEEIMVISDMCLSETEKKELHLLADSLKSALELACKEDDNRLSDVMFEVYRLKRTSPDHHHAVLKCIEAARATRKQSDDHSKNMRFYHEMETFKGCLVNKLQGDQSSVNAATSLITEMLSLVRCVEPEDGTTFLCESLMHDHHH